MLSQKIPLFRNKKLKFFISDLDKNLSSPYEIIWKVKNRGEESYKRNEVRGQLIHGKGREISEETAFSGSHFVECYIVQDNVCVARAKIDVPISVN